MLQKFVAIISALICISATSAFGAPVVSNVNAPQSAGVYQMLEVSFDLSTAATNLYWPYDTSPPASISPGVGVTVDGLFSNDNWATTIVVPGFYYQDYQRSIVNGLASTTPTRPLRRWASRTGGSGSLQELPARGITSCVSRTRPELPSIPRPAI